MSFFVSWMKNIDGWVVEIMWSKLNNFEDKPAELNPIIQISQFFGNLVLQKYRY